MATSSSAAAAAAAPKDYGAYIDRDLAVPGAPTGPLKGLTFAVKDLFDVSAGAALKGLADRANVPPGHDGVRR